MGRAEEGGLPWVQEGWAIAETSWRRGYLAGVKRKKRCLNKGVEVQKKVLGVFEGHEENEGVARKISKAYMMFNPTH